MDILYMIHINIHTYMDNHMDKLPIDANGIFKSTNCAISPFRCVNKYFLYLSAFYIESISI